MKLNSTCTMQLLTTLFLVSALPLSGCRSAGGASGGGAATASALTAAFKACGPDGVIDDGEDNNNQTSATGNRGGYWYTFVDKVGTTITPTAGEQGGTFKMSPAGAGNTKFGANMKGKVGTAEIVYGGMGFNFTDPKGPYDATKFKGVSFWAKKGPGSTGKVRLKVPDQNTDPDGKVCSACFNDFGADLNLTETWTKYTFPFSEMHQLNGWGSPHPDAIVPQKIYGMQWQVNQPGSNYDIWVDEVEFICQ